MSVLPPASHQILVAVEPEVLGHVIVELLRQTGVADEVTVAKTTRATVPGSRFDAAVASASLPGDVVVGTIVQLPDAHGSAGVGALIEGEHRESVMISTPLDVLELLDSHCPAATRRASGLTDALRLKATQPTHLFTGPRSEGEAR